ncbi:MAG: hypothetical protein Q9187_008993 [Circinaria calcarea]
MAEPTHDSSDPTIYKYLNAKTRGLLRQTQNARDEEERKSANMSADEQTFIAIKPDGIARGLVGEITSKFEKRGYGKPLSFVRSLSAYQTFLTLPRSYKIVGQKLVSPTKELLEKHYEDLADKPFYNGLITYNPLLSLSGPQLANDVWESDMLSGPISAMVWEGLDAVKAGRVILGPTNPLAAAPGTIRGDYAIDVGRNVCHGSDSVESAKKEIALWFAKGEVLSYKAANVDLIYAKS